MAEAIINSRLGDRWQAFSAGSKPAVAVHPLAIKVLDELDIQHAGKPKSINEFAGQSFDLVITLCEDVDDECPVWLGNDRQIHHPFPDPGKVDGEEAERVQAFRQVRDSIAKEIIPILNADSDQRS